ncbi:hypothetical protein VE03_04005 [Pseudogymnoascus sp. 23342-1-I1]|nr:hypothetical protein VE03_04005 [Pseudogymnoascus sp. 23342-1-I1]
MLASSADANKLTACEIAVLFIAVTWEKAAVFIRQLKDIDPKAIDLFRNILLHMAAENTEDEVPRDLLESGLEPHLKIAMFGPALRVVVRKHLVSKTTEDEHW